MEMKMERKGWTIKICLFVLLSLVSEIGLAVDIYSAADLQKYLGSNSALDDLNTVRLKKKYR